MRRILRCLGFGLPFSFGRTFWSTFRAQPVAIGEKRVWLKFQNTTLRSSKLTS
jgi:hypothetical protein